MSDHWIMIGRSLCRNFAHHCVSLNSNLFFIHRSTWNSNYRHIEEVWTKKAIFFCQSLSDSVVDPKLLLLFYFFGSGFGSGFNLILDPDWGPGCLWKIHLNCRLSKHRKKVNFIKIYIFGSRLFRKIHLNCSSSKHCKKANFFLICTFLQLCICYLETQLNLDSNPDPNPGLITDSDPNLKIISDPDAQHCFHKYIYIVHVHRWRMCLVLQTNVIQSSMPRLLNS
jgi:hypothetical protein